MIAVTSSMSFMTQINISIIQLRVKNPVTIRYLRAVEKFVLFGASCGFSLSSNAVLVSFDCLMLSGGGCQPFIQLLGQTILNAFSTALACRLYIGELLNS